MAPKSANLRFLLSLGNTKIVVLQNQDDLHVYTRGNTAHPQNKSSVVAEHVTEALCGK